MGEFKRYKMAMKGFELLPSWKKVTTKLFNLVPKTFTVVPLHFAFEAIFRIFEVVVIQMVRNHFDRICRWFVQYLAIYNNR